MSSNNLTYLRLNELQLGEFGYSSDPAVRVRGTFPLSVATGNANTAMVYFELEPGHRLGKHTDSAEEILIFLAGTASISVGTEEIQAEAGHVAVVPAMVPHDVRNIGQESVRVIGCFSSNTVMSTFEQPLIPLGEMPALPEAQRTMVTPPPALLESVPVPA